MSGLGSSGVPPGLPAFFSLSPTIKKMICKRVLGFDFDKSCGLITEKLEYDQDFWTSEAATNATQ